MLQETFNRYHDGIWKNPSYYREPEALERISRLLFLKYLGCLEHYWAKEAAVAGQPYRFIFEEGYRWENWATPIKGSGSPEGILYKTGDDLREFVNRRLVPYLQSFRRKGADQFSLARHAAEIFGGIKNRIGNGYDLRKMIDTLAEATVCPPADLVQQFEAEVMRIGSETGQLGEIFTPPPVVRAIVQVVKPGIQERVYCPAAGSGDFLSETFAYMTGTGDFTPAELKTIQGSALQGKDKRSFGHVLAVTSMMLHGISVPNVSRENPLREDLNRVRDQDRMDIVLANPPAKSKGRKEIQEKFAIPTSKTAYLYLQHMLELLKEGGRGAIVVRMGFLSAADSATVGLRKLLLNTCNLHTVLQCPFGILPAGEGKVAVLFFQKGKPTSNTWFYRLAPEAAGASAYPLRDSDFTEFLQFQRVFAESERSWNLPISAVNPHTFDLSLRHPKERPQAERRSPREIMDEIAALDAENAKVLSHILQFL